MPSHVDYEVLGQADGYLALGRVSGHRLMTLF